MGMSPFLSIMGSGATAFVYNGKFNPSRYLELLQGFEINVLCCTPTEYRMMAKLDNLQEYNLEHLHSDVSGEPLNREVVEQFRNNFNLTVRDGYGQTESTLLIGFLKDTKSRPGSMGKEIPGSRVTIVDDEGQPVETNVKGNIALPLDFLVCLKVIIKMKNVRKQLKRVTITLLETVAHIDEDGYLKVDEMILSSVLYDWTV